MKVMLDTNVVLDVRQTKSAHAEVILPDTSAFLAVVVLFGFHLARHGGEAPCGAFSGVERSAGFFAQLLAGNEFGHGALSFMREGVCLNDGSNGCLIWMHIVQKPPVKHLYFGCHRRFT